MRFVGGGLVLPKNRFSPHLFAGRYLRACRDRNRPDPEVWARFSPAPDKPGFFGDAALYYQWLVNDLRGPKGPVRSVPYNGTMVRPISR